MDNTRDNTHKHDTTTPTNTTYLKSNSRTDPSEPTDANRSRPLPALVKAIS